MGFWEPLFFWIFAVGALASSVAVLLFRNPLYSALSLIADFFCFAGLYVLLSAHFMAVTQVLVYGGAIMVLFVFIIMLLNLSDADLGPRRFSLHHILAVGVGIGVFVFSATAIWSMVDETKTAEARADAVTDYQMAVEAQDAEEGDAEPLYIVKTPSEVPGLYSDLSEDALIQEYDAKLDSWQAGDSDYADQKYDRFDPTRPMALPPALVKSDTEGVDDLNTRLSDKRGGGGLFGTVEPISILLVNRFVIPFELTAILLLAAIVGAVIIAKKRLD
ncbi:MAG: NADH-quinone oxidoreductase subunit J family protein [Myxococcota bacterium]